MRRADLVLTAAMLVSFVSLAPSRAAAQSTGTVQPPTIGESARDFTLNHIDGTPVALSALTKHGPVVVLMLRGWVGYQ